jgi:hypothetical protein
MKHGAENLLLRNIALSLYNVGIIWAHEIDIFRAWKLLNLADFLAVHAAPWRKLPYPRAPRMVAFLRY